MPSNGHSDAQKNTEIRIYLPLQNMPVNDKHDLKIEKTENWQQTKFKSSHLRGVLFVLSAEN